MTPRPPQAAPSNAGLSPLAGMPFWFAVLADHDSVGVTAAVLRAHATRELDHPSGRPWLLGCWPEGMTTVGQAGTAKIAVIGQHATSAEQLAEAAGRVRAAADLDRLAATLVGSAHLAASVGGQVRIQGTVTGVRRVFHAEVDGAPVAADRADVLASLLGAGLDERRLALQLLDPHVLYPLAGQPVWRGVDVLATDHYLLLDGDGRRRSVRWWSPPEPVVPMSEGAPGLRDALSAAVEARVRGRGLVSCDLGGVDSTSVCCMATRGEAKIVAYTAATRDPLADDVAWARRTVAALGTVEHHVIPAEEMPLVFDGVHGAGDPLDEPCSATADRERWLIIARRAAARGSGLHLTGFGGDELLYGSVAHLHDLVRTSPRVALRQLRGFAAKYRWPRGRVARQLADRSSYAQWLVRVADSLTDPKPPLNEPLLDWGFMPRLPPWATPAAAEAARDQIKGGAAAAAPLGSGRGQHRELETMRFVSRITRQFGQMAAGAGITLAAPYYDDRVVEAGLAVRPQERVTPWRYKPLIVEAMGGVVPAESLARQTKANGSGDEEPGLRRHRRDLLALFEESRLARLGLIDATALRELLGRPIPPSLQYGALDQTVACEVWLRSLQPATVPSQERP
jgi:asparagine synthase (glutamine-hydrolysing)